MIKEFKTHFTDHRVYNKRPHEVENVHATLRVKDYDGTGKNPDAWTEIHVAETYTNADGVRPVTKEVSLTLSPEQRAELLKMLLRDAGGDQ